MSHHEPLKALGPIDWTTVTGDDLKHFLATTFLHAQTVVDSIPAAAKPHQAGRARSHTDSSVIFDPSSRNHASTSASADAATADAAAHAAKLQKEWKEVKIPPRDNPYNMNVYKLAGKDGRGAWFARRSAHEGISFDKFRLGLEKEFGHTLQHTTGPGTGNVRGIGAERKAEHLECDGVGQADVWLLNAQFPGPTTPRDFVTLFLTGTTSWDSNKRDKGPRQFMIVSKPCNHPECAPRSGYIRGNYESVELIREIPIEKPLRRVRSSVDMRREDIQLPSRQMGGNMDIGQEAVLRAAQKRAGAKSDEGPGERGLSRSLSGLPPRETDEASGAGKADEDTEMAIEWVMVTRSDPGGSVPRFMVEKGTPGGIVTDAGKFLKWLDTRSAKDLEESLDEIPEVDATKDDAGEVTTSRPHQSSASVSRPAPEQSQVAAEEDIQPSGFYNMIAGAIGAASSMVTSRLPGIAHSTSELDSDLQDSDSDSDESERSFASAQEPEIETPLAKVLSGGDTSLGGGDMASMHSGKSEESPSKASVSHHEKHLKKLQDRHKKLAEKMARQQERASQGKSDQGDDALAKLKEKHEKEIARQEENYKKEVKKMEEKRLKEEKKAEERRKKQQEKDERSNMAMQLEKVKVERDMALKQIDILKEQVGQLQAQNTKLVAKLGKLGGLVSTEELSANGTATLDDGKLSQASSRSK
ncbi:hypothetical protein J7T55_009121 [Diaporthe amygdali]|uniref:uncharacterized protein n=1 Tax=Phomopsis amygdali TaxID=1214568 RepID=UPI0022FE35D4|nr:uncharacterized protein J7T55_009121 [Diaporthe amygdali]KAJ0118338.1 hypothetical protein J7T55_009121 [Diaporthe amygdali]